MAPRLLVVAGLKAEAGLVAGNGVVTVVGGGSREALEARLEAIDSAALGAVVSFGFAGALELGLPVGTVVIPRRVVSDGDEFAADGKIRSSWLKGFDSVGWLVRQVDLAGADAPAVTVRDKGELALRSGASAVDMESHEAASFAKGHRLPFGVLRVISDPADYDLPALVAQGMRPDGSMAAADVARALFRDPGQIPGLLRTARDAARAYGTLRRVRRLLGPRLGLHL